MVRASASLVEGECSVWPGFKFRRRRHAFVEFKPVFIPLLKNHEHFQIPIIPEMVDEERLCGCTGLYILCLFLWPVMSKNDI